MATPAAPTRRQISSAGATDSDFVQRRVDRTGWLIKLVDIASTLMILAVLFLSEIIPKTLGAVYWRQLAASTARFVQLLT